MDKQHKPRSGDASESSEEDEADETDYADNMEEELEAAYEHYKSRVAKNEAEVGLVQGDTVIRHCHCLSLTAIA